MMQIDILTLFPEMFKGVFEHSIISRAIKNKVIKINLHNLRDWATDKHKKVDDTPYGGGAGMVLKVDVIDRALHDLKLQITNYKSQTNSNIQNPKLKTILLTPQGKQFNQKIAKTLTKHSNLILICGHYEGFDERVRQLVDEEISIGQYVLTGGEIPAMIITDAVTRLLPGVLGKDESSQEESFSMEQFAGQAKRFNNSNKRSDSTTPTSEAIFEYPQYTKPENCQPTSKKFKRALKVPEILLSGNHALIKNWRLDKSLAKSKRQTS